MLMRANLPSLPGVAGNGWGERETNQNRLVYLVGLRDLEKQFFRGLLVIGPIEQHDSIRPCPRFQPRRAQTKVADFQLVRDDIGALLLFSLLLLTLAGYLYLRRYDFYCVIRGGQHRIADSYLVLPLPPLPAPCLPPLSPPLPPLRPLS